MRPRETYPQSANPHFQYPPNRRSLPSDSSGRRRYGHFGRTHQGGELSHLGQPTPLLRVREKIQCPSGPTGFADGNHTADSNAWRQVACGRTVGATTGSRLPPPTPLGVGPIAHRSHSNVHTTTPPFAPRRNFASAWSAPAPRLLSPRTSFRPAPPCSPGADPGALAWFRTDSFRTTPPFAPHRNLLPRRRPRRCPSLRICVVGRDSTLAGALSPPRLRSAATAQRTGGNSTLSLRAGRVSAGDMPAPQSA